MKNKQSQISLFTMDSPVIIAIVLSITGSLVNLVLPLYARKFIDLGAEINFSIQTILPIVTLLIIGSVLNAISAYLISYAGDRRIKIIRERLENKLLDIPISFYKKNSSGELVSRVINDSLIIKEFTTVELPTAIISVITLAGGIAILLYLDIKLTLVIVIAFSIVAFIAYPLGKINEKYSYSIQNQLSKLAQVINENVQNIKIIKLYNAINDAKHRFNDKNNKVYELAKEVDKIFSITGPIQTAFTLLAFLIIILYGSSRVADHTLSMGILASFMMYIFEIIAPINSLANFYLSYSEAKGAVKIIDKIMNEKEEVFKGKEIKVQTINKLEMKDISFKYPDSKTNVLVNVNLLFEPLNKIAIVGPSGAGKTTLINILTRIQNEFSGEISLNQINSEEFSLKSWRALFSVVTQENSIFSGSIKDNLTLGLSKQPTQSQLTEALDVANLTADISNLAKKLEYDVGENGCNLSGGQRQKIQIARAYLRNTPFVIFDEATSNLDPESETEILKAIDQLVYEKTLIVIAHRLSTIVNADKIYFLDNHKILGIGKHKTLLQKVPKYKAFVEDQFISKEG